MYVLRLPTRIDGESPLLSPSLSHRVVADTQSRSNRIVVRNARRGEGEKADLRFFSVLALCPSFPCPHQIQHEQPQVYRKIIDDTLREVLPDFEEYGVDEEVRRALQSVQSFLCRCPPR